MGERPRRTATRRWAITGATAMVAAGLAVLAPAGAGATPTGTRQTPASAPAEAGEAAPLPPPGQPALPRGTVDTGAGEGSPLPEILLGDDDRQPVAHPRSSPHGAIGTLYASFGGAAAPCTGFLIYSDTVATAAHCLYDSDTRKKASYVTFRAADTPSTGGFFECHTTNPENIRVAPSYVSSPREGNDLGVIKVRCSDGINDNVNVLDYTGWLGFTPVDRYGNLVELAGYPSSVRGAPVESTMYTDEGRIVSTGTNVLKYKIDATSGQSGAPVFDRISAPTVPVTGWYVLAIHGGGGRDLPDPRLRNWGARTAGANYQLLYNWCLRPVRPG